MLPYKRPEPHDDFATESERLLKDLRADVTARGGVPHGSDFTNREIWTAKWQRAGNSRGVHKAKLVGPEPWSAKCAYCEQFRAAKRELNVDHYRPKALITEWAGTPSYLIEEPPKEIDVGLGYWWLAFTWKNYSLACDTCNQGSKRNLFPVQPPRAPCVEGVESTERPLLLDPGSGFRTRNHFRWTFGGVVEPISDEGHATIVTCGLNRRDLTVRREKVALDVSRELNEFKLALRGRDASAQRDALRKIARRGSRAEEFTSMVRWLVEECLRCAWDRIEGMPP